MALHAEPMFMLDLRKGEKLDHQTLYVVRTLCPQPWYCGHLKKPKGVLAFVTIESCWGFSMKPLFITVSCLYIPLL